LNDDGIRQAIFPHPLLQDQRNAARVRQDGDQGNIRVVNCEFRQLEPQASPDNDGTGTAFACLSHIGSVLCHGTHDIDNYHAPAARDAIGGGGFAVKRDKVDAINQRLVTRL
jgi:hypothetical protein